MAKIEERKEDIIENGVYLSEYLNEELQNSESDLIVKDGMLYKIILYNPYKREKIMSEFDKHKEELPIPLVDLVYENGNFYAYVMELLEDYITLNEFLKSNINLEDRKKVSIEIVKIAETLEKYGLIYVDWHSKNLVYNGDTQLLDIDSTIQTNNSKYIAKSRKNILSLCLSVITGCDLDFDYPDISDTDRGLLLEKIIPEEDVLFSDEIPLEFDYIKEKINEVDCNMIKDKKSLILKEINNLA